MKITEVVTDIASQIKIELSDIKITEGKDVGCLDTHLVHVKAKGRLVNVLVYQSEVDELEKGVVSERLELRIRAALARLKILLEP